MQSSSESGLLIAIDGPAASGKSTLGSAIADTLGYRFLDTGKMYRAVTLKALEKGVASDDEAALFRIAQAVTFDLAGSLLLVDGSPAGQELHSPDVDSKVSEVSSHPSVRSILVRRQRELAGGTGIVMVGRDIGTIVLPTAPVKLWLTASQAERARRRLHDEPEYIAREGHEAALVRLGSRDQIDSTRTHSPLQKAPDAIIVNTDGQSPRQVLDQALAAIRVVSSDGPS